MAAGIFCRMSLPIPSWTLVSLHGFASKSRRHTASRLWRMGCGTGEGMGARRTQRPTLRSTLQNCACGGLARMVNSQILTMPIPPQAQVASSSTTQEGFSYCQIYSATGLRMNWCQNGLFSTQSPPQQHMKLHKLDRVRRSSLSTRANSRVRWPGWSKASLVRTALSPPTASTLSTRTQVICGPSNLQKQGNAASLRLWRSPRWHTLWTAG
mmetsp:Transcript_10507/g.38673  ORF Transcript_10507/g.38673 Transcript_10507/m.38673 type:complete len:211 (+) Transcript_10507:565-1197(+)